MIFENELNHWGKGLTGLALSNSLAHDEIVMIRTIEVEAKAIIQDPEILHPCKFDKKKMLHIYKDYCATKCTEERNEKGELIDLPNVSVSLIGEAVNLAFLHF
jgi:hypothetical protein